jgi:hypothetical protein
MEGEDSFSRVSRSIARVLDGQPKGRPRIVNTIFFGEEGPEELVIYLAYEDAKTLTSAQKGGDAGRIEEALLAALRDEGYPERPIQILFISEEEVERSGGPFTYFK